MTAGYQTAEQAAREARLAECAAALAGVKRPKVYRQKVRELVRAADDVLAFLTRQGAGNIGATIALVRAKAAVEVEQGE